MKEQPDSGGTSASQSLKESILENQQNDENFQKENAASYIPNAGTTFQEINSMAVGHEEEVGVYNDVNQVSFAVDSEDQDNQQDESKPAKRPSSNILT